MTRLDVYRTTKPVISLQMLHHFSHIGISPFSYASVSAYTGVGAAVKRTRKTQGFTLLELLVVVAIIGLLAAYVGPKYFTQIGRSEQAVAKSQIESFSRALGAYRIDVGSYPSTEEGLNALVTKPTDSAKAIKWNGPYLVKAPPADPWGKPYLYRSPAAKSDYELSSYGKDGQPGGTGDAADINYQ
jgi:general secretion pathway protein G